MSEPTNAIEIRDWDGNAGSYRHVPIDSTDPRHLDPLVMASSYNISGESYYARTDGNNWPYCRRIEGSLNHIWCRRLVAEKLVGVNELLRSHDCEVHLFDAYRPVSCQVGLWNHFAELAEMDMPNSSPMERQEFVLKYVSDPTKFVREDSTTWPAHTSGAAVDLSLKDRKTGKILDMGARFDEMDQVSHSDYYEREAIAKRTLRTDLIRRNRRLLHWAMNRLGFVNYPLEFWHFDWGDQMYVFNQRAMNKSGPTAAWFGYMEPPEAQ